eukprot:6208750-Pleurochrysis_carterae.AAC.2
MRLRGADETENHADDRRDEDALADCVEHVRPRVDRPARDGRQPAQPVRPSLPGRLPCVSPNANISKCVRFSTLFSDRDIRSDMLALTTSPSMRAALPFEICLPNDGSSAFVCGASSQPPIPHWTMGYTSR